MRQYVGIEIGSKFQCVLVSEEKLDDEILVNIGIRKNGEGRLRKTKPPEYVTLNYFMLDTIYKILRRKTTRTRYHNKEIGRLSSLFHTWCAFKILRKRDPSLGSEKMGTKVNGFSVLEVDNPFNELPFQKIRKFQRDFIENIEKTDVIFLSAPTGAGSPYALNTSARKILQFFLSIQLLH